MTTPQESLEADLKAAMKARDTARLATLRLLLAAVKNQRIALGRDVDDKEFASLVRKAVKQRHDAAAQYRQGHRPELAEKEESEIGHLEAYLPAQVDEGEIRQAVEDFIAREGLSGPQDMGKVMKAMIERFGGSADGATISRVAKERLTAS